jgi:hypothetical protein
MERVYDFWANPAEGHLIRQPRDREEYLPNE